MRSAKPTLATILILGGTREARILSDRLSETQGLRPLLSLAGVTGQPRAVNAETRRGGFGGAEGLARYLRESGVAALIDASHPFAAQMSRNAATAAAATGAPLLRLERAAWIPRPGERWRRYPTLTAAAEAPPPGARVFLAIGPGSAAAFVARPDLWCAIRRLEPSDAPFPLAQGRWVVGAPSTSPQAERALFEDLKIAWLIAKNSGGARAKLDAAALMGIEIAIIDRPVPPQDVATTTSVEEAVAWARRYGESDGD